MSLPGGLMGATAEDHRPAITAAGQVPLSFEKSTSGNAHWVGRGQVKLTGDFAVGTGGSDSSGVPMVAGRRPWTDVHDRGCAKGQFNVGSCSTVLKLEQDEGY